MINLSFLPLPSSTRSSLFKMDEIQTLTAARDHLSKMIISAQEKNPIEYLPTIYKSDNRRFNELFTELSFKDQVIIASKIPNFSSLKISFNLAKKFYSGEIPIIPVKEMNPKEKAIHNLDNGIVIDLSKSAIPIEWNKDNDFVNAIIRNNCIPFFQEKRSWISPDSIALAIQQKGVNSETIKILREKQVAFGYDINWIGYFEYLLFTKDEISYSKKEMIEFLVNDNAFTLDQAKLIKEIYLS